MCLIPVGGVSFVTKHRSKNLSKIMQNVAEHTRGKNIVFVCVNGKQEKTGNRKTGKQETVALWQLQPAGANELRKESIRCLILLKRFGLSDRSPDLAGS